MTEPRQHLLPVSPLRVLSLFSGIGGLDLGLERAGMTVIAHSEVDPYASRVLAKHWPNVPNLGDITAIDEWPDADVICGGFPCQDISLAGKGAGIKEGTRSGLWSYYVAAIRHVRPRYVIVENVAALIARGFDIVQSDLAALGYSAWWDCVPAAAVGAPHLRDRVFIVATRSDVAPFDTDTSPMQWAQEQRCEPYRDTEGAATDAGGEERAQQHGEAEQAAPDRHPRGGHPDGLRIAVADADNAGREEQRGGVANGEEHQAPERGGWWGTEPSVGRVAHGIPKRVDRLRCLGNAVVPQVGEYIGSIVVAHHEARRVAA